MYQTKNPCFFASANTANGFQSRFSDVFNPERFKKIYIIKGGPGTGKSSLMKSIEKIAMDQQLDSEVFICSSDPNSLDGIILKNKGIAILDGTSPHIYEPNYPGAIENIINTGSFWNSNTLMSRRSEIIHKMKEKNRCYKRAYRFLRAYGETEEEIKKIFDSNILHNKLQRSVQRMMDKESFTSGAAKESIRLEESVTSEGVVKLNTFENLSKKVFLLYQNEYVALEYFNQIYLSLKEKGCDMVLGYSCKYQDRISSIYLPLDHTTFIFQDKKSQNPLPNKEYHYLNMKRFYDSDQIHEHLQKIHFGKRCSQMLISGATEALREAKMIHSELEKIYISSMDFDKFNSERTRLISMIFS